MNMMRIKGMKLLSENFLPDSMLNASLGLTLKTYLGVLLIPVNALISIMAKNDPNKTGARFQFHNTNYTPFSPLFEVKGYYIM